ncbi:Bypass of stop codon protein 6 [Psilocybe cubensis]|uniref:Bypass of stop codon protein 6 n=1 Tax=Psilocybe cubensis TaxID=181762 RepID=A0ACB8HDT1_PSICU|nr:Bypass of stop codon protein 6 [Psilocybe cubensis]KAH9485772.1 Bypass of stop codon protein 6 [Psilocybe cubensis]
MTHNDSLTLQSNKTFNPEMISQVDIPTERDPLLVKKASLSLSSTPTLSKAQKRAGIVQFLALCWSLFMIGWNDGSIGPLLPRIMQVFDVRVRLWLSIRLSFVIGQLWNGVLDLCADMHVFEKFDSLPNLQQGVVFGALANMPLNDKYGYGKILVLGAILQMFAFITQSSARTLPFSAFAASFFLGGIGMAIQDAQCNGYIALVKHEGELKMGFLQASYGLGALIAPLSSTQFAQAPTRWSGHYLISFVLSVLNVILLSAVFKFRAQDECLRESGEIIPESAIRNAVSGSGSEGDGKYMQMLRMKAVHLLALFLILYIGVEVTIGGWIVTFMMVVRGGGPESGYVAAGFFGGLTLGRIALIWVNQKLGEVRAVYLYTALVIFAQLLVWIVPSRLINALLVCTIGLLLGPMYPIAIRHAARVIPRSLVTGAIGWIAACGAAGSALLPFVTGRIAEEKGIGSLMPFLLVMMAVMGVVWFMVPTKPVEEE